MAFGIKLPTATFGMKPPNLRTGMVHPLVRASMLPRLKMARATNLNAQSSMMRGLARSAQMPPTTATGTPSNAMSLGQLRSRRQMRGHKVPLSGMVG